MRFLPITSASLFTTISRHFSTRGRIPRLPQLSKIPPKHRPKVVSQAQQALTDYLHTTRCLGFTYAERISKNSLFSLSNLISKVDFLPRSPSDFSRDFTRFLRYHPINEFEFFFESIGIPFSEIQSFLPSSEFFLSEDESILKAALALSAFGFPWDKLGMLYKEEVSIFGKDSEALNAKLRGLNNIGFDTSSVVGICLCFPVILSQNDDLVSEIDALLDVLKRVFLNYNLKSSVEGNVDLSYAFCRKIQIFIDLGCKKKEIGETMGKRRDFFLECSEEILVQKVDFFRRLNARKADIGMLLLRYPDFLRFDLESPMFSVTSFLKQFGLNDEELNAIANMYPYVLGKNRLVNLPHVMRALDLHEKFFDKIVNGNFHLLTNFDIGSLDENLEKDYKICLERIRSMKTYNHELNKLNFLLGIGFGENLVTMEVLSKLHGPRNVLQERFDYLLDSGVEFSKLCKMIKRLPKVLNQRPDVVGKKLDFLCNEAGSSLQFLDVFPGILCFDLENRIKPRYRIHKWLKEKGVKKEYSLASIVATSENGFISRLLSIHPTVLKQWLECFSSKNHYYSFGPKE